METDRVGVAPLDLLVLILLFGLVRLWVRVVLEPGRGAAQPHAKT